MLQKHPRPSLCQVGTGGVQLPPRRRCPRRGSIYGTTEVGAKRANAHVSCRVRPSSPVAAFGAHSVVRRILTPVEVPVVALLASKSVKRAI